MMVAIGNFLFHARNVLFPLACLLLLVPGAPIFRAPFSALLWGLVIGLCGETLRILTIGLKYIIRGGRNRRVYAEELITDGLYAHSRNPMYIGNLLLLTGLALAANSWLAVALAVPACAFAYRAIIAAEESYLRGKFGGDYLDYMHDVPRWFPRLTGLTVTVGNSRFHWRRVATKEYGTACAWLAGLSLLGLRNLFGVASESVVQTLWFLLATSVVAWSVLFTLKKRRYLVAD